jgi:hypothetical protein
LTTDRTIEPTQVAGFDQLFDDFNGTTAWNYAGGIHARLSPSVYAGSQLTFRQLDVPVSTPTGFEQLDWQDRSSRTYLHWLVTDKWILTAEGIFDSFHGDGDKFFPSKVNTLSLPIGVRYFSPSGFFAGSTVNFVHQNVRNIVDSYSGNVIDEADSNFTTLDALVGYRFPGRRGSAILEARNILGKTFDFRDDNFQTPEARRFLSQYIPDPMLLATINLNF